MTAYRNPPSRKEKWKTRVLKTPTLSHGTRLFLVHTLAKHMKADGYVSQPRKKLAWEANLSERQVTRYMSNAVDAGWLVVMQPGYRSMTAEYQAVFPNPNSGTQDVSHSEPEKGDANWPALGVTNTSLIPARKRDVGRPTTSSSTTRRLRVVDADRKTTAMRTRAIRSSLRLCFDPSYRQTERVAETPPLACIATGAANRTDQRCLSTGSGRVGVRTKSAAKGRRISRDSLPQLPTAKGDE